MDRTGAVAIAILAGAAAAVAGEAERPRAFTLGVVQRQLRQGLSQTEVVERLGSPNILTRDASGREAWVYDRLATERESAGVSLGVGGGGIGGSDSFAAGGAVHAGWQKRKARSSQRTLTVVVRFTAGGLVESFSWHDSRF